VKDLPYLSLEGIPLLDDPNIQQFIFALLQMMSQMPPGPSQNVSVAAATEREENVDDDGEKEVKEEVKAVKEVKADEKMKMKK